MKILSLPKQTTASIGEQAERRLRESPYFFLKHVRCDFAEGVLTLRGTVPMGQLRSFAESIVSRIDGVQYIDNRVEVADPQTGQFTSPAVRNAG